MNREDRIDILFGKTSILDVFIKNNTNISIISREVQWFTDAELESEDIYEKAPEELNTRLNSFYPKNFQDKGDIRAHQWKGIKRGKTLITEDANQSVLALFTQGNNKAYIAEYLDNMSLSKKKIDTTPKFKHFSMSAAANIAGESYFAGKPRKLFKRVGPGDWIDLTDEKAHPHMYVDVNRARKKTKFVSSEIPLGFQAVDGYSDKDIYAGGLGGDMWHFNGSRWQALDIPTNHSVQSICCAPDGYVYVGCERGTLLRGQLVDEAEKWELIPYEVDPSDDFFQSMTWFQGALWLGGWRGTYHLDPKAEELMVKRYQYPDGGAKQFSFGGVCSCEDTLVAWGPTQVLLYDGEKWEYFINTDNSLVVPDNVAEAMDKVAAKE